MREGLIPDPFWRDQAEQCQWVEAWDWSYTREANVPEGWVGAWVVMELDGLDTFATVLLNGQEIGKSVNMFIPHRFEVGQALVSGRNRIEVRLEAPGKAVAGKPVARYSSCFASDRVYSRKLQCTYGWDWVHRFVSSGIWQPARLVCYQGARIADLFVDTRSADADFARLSVQVEIERKSMETVSAQVTIRDPQGRVVGEAPLEFALDHGKWEWSLPNPQRWWPNGYGSQPLYACTVVLADGNGQILDEKSASFGIRTVKIEEIPDQAGSSFTLIVNGQPIFARGGNWVPADPFPSRITKEHYTRLIALAKAANMNLLRAWGGGLYEPQAFWDACDRAGVMVSQDLLLACADYPEDDPEFMGVLRIEFAVAIRLLRQHPSLAFWSGNNELGMNSDPASDFSGKKIGLEISGPLCQELDPGRPYRITSPFGGNPNNSQLAGDCHASAWYNPDFFHSDMQDYRQRIEACVGRFMSEYAIPGAPPVRMLLKCMQESDLADPQRRMLDYHTKDNPYNGIDDATHYFLLERTAEALFGQVASPVERIRKMEYVQYEWVRLAVEAARRQQWYCSGIQFWMYNDCWPASGWSLVDYYGFAKAGYYAARRAYQTVIASIVSTADRLQVWVCNNRTTSARGMLHLSVRPWQGGPSWKSQVPIDVPPNSSAVIAELPHHGLSPLLDGQSVFVCDLQAGEDRDRAWWYAGVPRQMRLPQACLRLQGPLSGVSGELAVSADAYARVVQFEADVDFSDNYFDLLPGETKRVTWRSPSGQPVEKIGVSCWNGTPG
jgi:beta-mannosidase